MHSCLTRKTAPMPKVVDHKQRQKELADVALNITSDHGINAVTIRAVSKKSGWSTGVVNYYFSSRHAILLSALHRAAALQGKVFAEILGDKSLDPVMRLQRMVESVLPLDPRRVALTRVFQVFYAEAMSDEATCEAVKRYLQNWRRVMERILKEAQGCKQIDSDLDPAHAAADLVAISDGLAMHAILDPAVADQVKEYGISLNLFGHTWEFAWLRNMPKVAT